MRSSVVLMLFALGCGGEESEPPPSEPPPSITCTDPAELQLPDSSCIRPGIPPDGCAPGFDHDGEYGCNAILPAEACPPGRIAVPGDSACRPVMPCAAGTWGDIPVDATTEYVDGSYTGGASDGSEAQPWTTIGEAVLAAASGAIVAIARGTYVEDIVILYQPVRLWGVCPDEVTIEATGQSVSGCAPAAVCLRSLADGSELRGLSLRGSGLGVLVWGAEQVLLDSLHIHDLTDRGIDVEGTAAGASSVTVRNVLVEQAREFGIFVYNADAAVEASLVRTTTPVVGSMGRGINVQGPPANVTIVGSLVEQNLEDGIFSSGANLTIDGSVVRHTQPRAFDQGGGRGVTSQGFCELTATEEVFCPPAARGNTIVRGSLFEHNHEAGVTIFGTDVTFESSVVRATLPQASNQGEGIGIGVQPFCIPTYGGGGVCDPTSRPKATLRGLLVEENHDCGVYVGTSDATLEALVVRNTLPRADNQWWGRGITIQNLCVVTPNGGSCDPTARSNATVRGSLVDHNYELGLFVGNSDSIVEASVVRGTAAQAFDGLYGDGIAIFGYDSGGVASALVTNVRVEQSARAGLSNFGAFVAAQSTRIQCAVFDLAGEPAENPYVYEDRGDNLCGCPAAEQACQVKSAGLLPPAPLATDN